MLTLVTKMITMVMVNGDDDVDDDGDTKPTL